MALAMMALSAQSASKVNFRGVLALLQQTVETWRPVASDIADDAGLKLARYDTYEEYEFTSHAIYYACNARVLDDVDEDYNRRLEVTGGNACVLGLEAGTSSGGSIRFSEEEDYERFFREAVEHGLLQEKGRDDAQYFVNATPLQVGEVIQVSNAELFSAMLGETENAQYHPQFMLTPKGMDCAGWYTYDIGIDF